MSCVSYFSQKLTDFDNNKTDLDPGVRSSSSEEPSDPMGSHKRQDNLTIEVLVTSPKRVNARPPIRRTADIPISTSPATFAEGGESTGGLNDTSSQMLRDKEQGQELSYEQNQSVSPGQYFDNIDNEVFGIDQISSTSEQSSSPIISSSPSDMFGIGLEDPTWRVLPAALKKHNISDEGWQNYVLFVWYGTTGEEPSAVFLNIR